MPRMTFEPGEEDVEEFPDRIPAFGWRDMLLPDRLLTATNWSADPLAQYAGLRARRPLRWVAGRLFELLILAVAVVSMCSDKEYLMLLGVVAFVPLLIRYHLFVNDQSMFVKTLSQNRLEELMLTRLGRNEYFLHQFLLFCRTYRLVYGFFILLLLYPVIPLYSALPTGRVFGVLFALFILMMQAWVAGVCQFTLEWRLFAGGRLSSLRGLMSMALTLGLGLLILVGDFGIVVFIQFVQSDPLVAFGTFAGLQVLFWAVAFGLTFCAGRRIYLNAVDLLRRRLDPAFYRPLATIKALDLLLPWRWAARSPDRGVPVRLEPDARLRAVLSACLHGLGFFYAAGLFTVLLQEWAALSRGGAALVADTLVFAVGFYYGRVLAGQRRPLAPGRVRDVFGRIGVCSVAVVAAVFLGRAASAHAFRVEALATLYLQAVACAMAALGCGVYDAGSPRRWSPAASLGLVAMALFLCGLNAYAPRILDIGLRFVVYFLGRYSATEWLLKAIGGLILPLAAYFIVFLTVRVAIEDLWLRPDAAPQADGDDAVLEKP